MPLVDRFKRSLENINRSVQSNKKAGVKTSDKRAKEHPSVKSEIY